MKQTGKFSKQDLLKCMLAVSLFALAFFSLPPKAYALAECEPTQCQSCLLWCVGACNCGWSFVGEECDLVIDCDYPGDENCFIFCDTFQCQGC
jgi:hypothetical protein